MVLSKGMRPCLDLIYINERCLWLLCGEQIRGARQTQKDHLEASVAMQHEKAEAGMWKLAGKRREGLNWK